ncbi:MAG: nucleotidyltransferase [Cyclobacteriaceae bacterium]|nr:nucleotidyltransferase [Cyclobacteriaceae bacterium]
MTSLAEIKSKLKKQKPILFREYPISSMAIFGSYARQEQKEMSDLDILVEFNAKIGIRFIDLANAIEDVVKVKVDLVSKNGIKEKYLYAITSELIYV